MNNQLSVTEVAQLLDNHQSVFDSYVLLREIKVYLQIAQEEYHPEIAIKIYLSNVISDQPYHFEVSHLVHTPTQIGPYGPSTTFASTEEQAIKLAISSTTRFLEYAIREGHALDSSWLIPNKRF